MHSQRTLYACFIFIFVNNVIQLNAFRSFRWDGGLLFLAVENEAISLECKNDMPMAYCGFSHPSGKRFSFSGRDLDNGRCTLHINATKDLAGEWKCHIGRGNIGVETIHIILVRIVNQLAAVRNNITTKCGHKILLQCVTTKLNTPIRYCRFEPPNGPPFSIDSTINKTNPIENKYYFPENMSLDRGDCAAVISKVVEQDMGIWTCSAGFDDDREYIDQIKLVVEGAYPPSTASTNSIVVIVVAIVAAILFCVFGYIAWAAKNKAHCCRGRRRRAAEGQQRGARVTGTLRRMGGWARAWSSMTQAQIPNIVVQSPSDPTSEALTLSPIRAQTPMSPHLPDAPPPTPQAGTGATRNPGLPYSPKQTASDPSSLQSSPKLVLDKATSRNGNSGILQRMSYVSSMTFTFILALVFTRPTSYIAGLIVTVLCY